MLYLLDRVEQNGLPFGGRRAFVRTGKEVCIYLIFISSICNLSIICIT